MPMVYCHCSLRSTSHLPTQHFIIMMGSHILALCTIGIPELQPPPINSQLIVVNILWSGASISGDLTRLNCTGFDDNIFPGTGVLIYINRLSKIKLRRDQILQNDEGLRSAESVREGKGETQEAGKTKTLNTLLCFFEFEYVHCCSTRDLSVQTSSFKFQV